MNWNVFDQNCDAFNAFKQHELETDAMAMLQTAITEGKGIREAVTYVLEVGVSDDNNWLVVVDAIQKRPNVALAIEVDAKFFPKCPKCLLEEFVAGKEGLFAQLVNRVSTKAEKAKDSEFLDNGDFRLMHMIADGLHTLGKLDYLKKAAKTFQEMSKLNGDGGMLPNGLMTKLIDFKAIERPSQANSKSQTAPRPIRRVEEKHEQLTGAKHLDTRPAKPANGSALPDNSMAAQLAKVKVSVALAPTVN